MPEPSAQAFAPPTAGDPILAEVVDRLRDLYRPERIYLFGSTARGESGPDSDYDLMVIVSDHTPAHFRDSGKAYKALWRLGVARDVLVWTHSDFEDRLHLKASLPSTIAREGILISANLSITGKKRGLGARLGLPDSAESVDSNSPDKGVRRPSGVEASHNTVYGQCPSGRRSGNGSPPARHLGTAGAHANDLLGSGQLESEPGMTTRGYH